MLTLEHSDDAWVCELEFVCARAPFKTDFYLGRMSWQMLSPETLKKVFKNTDLQEVKCGGRGWRWRPLVVPSGSATPWRFHGRGSSWVSAERHSPATVPGPALRRIWGQEGQVHFSKLWLMRMRKANSAEDLVSGVQVRPECWQDCPSSNKVSGSRAPPDGLDAVLLLYTLLFWGVAFKVGWEKRLQLLF